MDVRVDRDGRDGAGRDDEVVIDEVVALRAGRPPGCDIVPKGFRCLADILIRIRL
jgi:hypothetical protein